MQKQPRRTKSVFASLILVPLLVLSTNAFAFNWFGNHAQVSQQVKSNFSGQHAKFVESVVDSTYQTNQQILSDRKQLLSLQTQYQSGKDLSAGDKHWLMNLASEYKIASPNFNSKGTWQELDKRVDIVPVSLVLAQAIQESGWGNSHIARHANNYFGQECFSRGCGVSTGHNRRGNYYEMAKFDDIDDAINTYIHNLNSNKAYKQMRNIRYNERSQKKNINSIELVNGLMAYSELGNRYISSIKKVVNHLKLQQFDKFV
jgi:Bax protein